MDLSALPHELLLRVLSQLSVLDLARLHSVSSALHHFLIDNARQIVKIQESQKMKFGVYFHMNDGRFLTLDVTSPREEEDYRRTAQRNLLPFLLIQNHVFSCAEYKLKDNRQIFEIEADDETSFSLLLELLAPHFHPTQLHTNATEDSLMLITRFLPSSITHVHFEQLKDMSTRAMLEASRGPVNRLEEEKFCSALSFLPFVESAMMMVQCQLSADFFKHPSIYRLQFFDYSCLRAEGRNGMDDQGLKLCEWKECSLSWTAVTALGWNWLLKEWAEGRRDIRRFATMVQEKDKITEVAILRDLTEKLERREKDVVLTREDGAKLFVDGATMNDPFLFSLIISQQDESSHY